VVGGNYHNISLVIALWKLLAITNLMKNLAYVLCLVALWTYGQHPSDTLYVKSLDEYVESSRWGNGIVELSNHSLMLSYGYNGGITYCDARPGLLFIDQTGSISNASYTGVGNGVIKETADGHFINVRNLNNTVNCSLGAIQVAKYDLNGTMLWAQQRSYGVCNNSVFDVVETADGGIAVIGIFSIASCIWPFYNTFFIKFNSEGEEEWVRFYGTNQLQHQGRVLHNTADNGFVFLSYSPYTTLYVIKTDALGNVEWSTPIHHEGEGLYSGDLDVLPDGSMIVGTTANTDHVLVKLSATGVIEDKLSYSRAGIASPIASVGNVKYLEDIDMYLFVSDRFFIVDTDGTIQWRSINFREELPEYSVQYINTVIITENGEIVATGATQKPTDNPHEFITGVALIRFTTPSTLISNYEDEEETGGEGELTEVLYYPNPTKGDVYINLPNSDTKTEIEVFNVLGQRIYNRHTIGQRQIKVPIRGAAGMYFITLSSLNRTLKIVKE